MTQVRYLGTGEAFAHRLPNTSVVYEGAQRVLLDCGYSVPQALWRASLDPDWLDAIYLTHFHADHCFGLPAVLARMGEDGRERPLTLVGGKGSQASTERVLETGYPGLVGKCPFDVNFVEVPPGQPVVLGDLTVATARSNHSVPNHSVRIAEGPVSVCYSGDGGPTPETEALYAGATLLIHEAYYPDWSDKQTHASIPQVRELAQRAGVDQLHLLHLKRSATRPDDVVLPTPGDVFSL